MIITCQWHWQTIPTWGSQSTGTFWCWVRGQCLCWSEWPQFMGRKKWFFLVYFSRGDLHALMVVARQARIWCLVVACEWYVLLYGDGMFAVTQRMSRSWRCGLWRSCGWPCGTGPAWTRRCSCGMCSWCSRCHRNSRTGPCRSAVSWVTFWCMLLWCVLTAIFSLLTHSM